MNENLIAVDIGGTWIRTAEITEDGLCGSVIRKPTQRQRPFEDIFDDLVDAIQAAASSRIDAISVGVPTVLDERGGLEPCDNLPTMGNIILSQYLENKFGVPVKLFNDASCFTIGEWWMGTGKGTQNFIGITLGTGIGVGIIINGLLYTGSHRCAGEIWKTTCRDGQLEADVCGKSIEQRYYQARKQYIKGKTIAEQARNGDSVSVEVFMEFGRSLGQVVSFLINVLDPETVGFGGSVSQAFDLFEPSLREVVCSGTVAGTKVQLQPSILGETASLYGAARLLRHTIS